MFRASKLCFAKLAGLSLLSLSVFMTSGCQSFGKKSETTIAKASQSEQGYYNEAQKNLNKGNYARAIVDFNNVRTFYPVGKYAEQALLDLMYAQFQQGSYTDAVASAERFIQLYATNPQVDYAYYVRGVANMHEGFGGFLKYTDLNPAHRDMGYSRLAFANFQELITKFPNSSYSPDAAQRMRHIYNQFAENEMNTARWYIKRKAYLAAANRAKWVFQYYPQSIQIPEAIATMAYSYDKLGMTDTANQYKQLLTINYPQLLDKNGQVKLANALTKNSWLDITTLGIWGKGNRTAKLSPNSHYQGATKTQVIQGLQQAMALKLPEETSTQSSQSLIDAPQKKVKIGLGLPDNEIHHDSTNKTNNIEIVTPNMVKP